MKEYRKALQRWKEEQNALGGNYCSGYDCRREATAGFRLCERCRLRILKSTRKRAKSGKLKEYWSKPINRERQLAGAIETQKRQKEKNPELYALKSRAHAKVYYAVKTGRLLPQPCEKCGRTDRVQAHHHKGYEPDFQLDVQWLCPRCHAVEEGRVYAV